MFEKLGYSPEKGLHILDSKELTDKADKYFRRANSFTNRENADERLRLAKKGKYLANLAKWRRREESDD